MNRVFYEEGVVVRRKPKRLTIFSLFGFVLVGFQIFWRDLLELALNRTL